MRMVVIYRFGFVSIFSNLNIAIINFLLKTKLEVGLLTLGQSHVALDLQQSSYLGLLNAGITSMPLCL